MSNEDNEDMPPGMPDMSQINDIMKTAGIDPEAVMNGLGQFDDIGKYIDYLKESIIPLFVKEIKELKADVKELKKITNGLGTTNAKN